MTPTSSGSYSGLGHDYPYERNKSSVYQYRGDFSWLRGAHTFKFGVDLRDYPTSLYDPEQLEVTPTGSFTGGPNANSPASASGTASETCFWARRRSKRLRAADGLPSFLLRRLRARCRKAHQETHRDLWCALGLESGEVENNNQYNYIDLTSASPIASKVPQFPGLKGGVGIPGSTGPAAICKPPRPISIRGSASLCLELEDHHPRRIWNVSHAGRRLGAIPGCLWHLACCRTPSWRRPME